MSLLEVIKKARDILVSSPRAPLYFTCIDHCCQGFYSIDNRIKHSGFSALYLAAYPATAGLFAEATVNRESNVRYDLDYSIESENFVFKAGQNCVRVNETRYPKINESGCANIAPCQIFKKSISRFSKYDNLYKDGLFALGITSKIYPEQNSIKVFNKTICFLEGLQKKSNEAI